MRQRSRTNASIVNSFTAGFAQVANLVLSFVSRTFFIKILGEQYLGLNGLFVNILSILSFAELGIGAAITFSLYKPLADDDQNQVLALMQLYRRVYHIIAVLIFVLGVALIPVLNHLISGSTRSVGNIQLAFFLFLMNSVVSYLWNYKRSIFFADQQGYINSINTLIFQVGGQVLQIILLFVIPSYYIYLIVQMLMTLGSNLQISHVANQRYPYLKSRKRVSVPAKTLQYLKKNVVGMISSKLGGIVVTGTDNILLSSFLGLATVAVYSNYTLIMNGMTSIINQAVSAVTASIGNLKTTQNKLRERQVFYSYTHVSAVISFAIGLGLITFFGPFITFWVGGKYVLGNLTTYTLVIGFFVTQLRQSNINFTNAYGLYWEQRIKPIVESLVNLVVSLILIGVFHAGLISVVLGNLSSNIFINSWWEPLIVLRHGLEADSKDQRFYFKLYGLELILGCSLMAIAFWISKQVSVNALFAHVFLSAVVIIVMTIIFDVAVSTYISKRQYSLPVTRRILAKLIRR